MIDVSVFAAKLPVALSNNETKQVLSVVSATVIVPAFPSIEPEIVELNVLVPAIV